MKAEANFYDLEMIIFVLLMEHERNSSTEELIL